MLLSDNQIQALNPVLLMLKTKYSLSDSEFAVYQQIVTDVASSSTASGTFNEFALLSLEFNQALDGNAFESLVHSLISKGALIAVEHFSLLKDDANYFEKKEAEEHPELNEVVTYAVTDYPRIFSMISTSDLELPESLKSVLKITPKFTFEVVENGQKKQKRKEPKVKTKKDDDKDDDDESDTYSVESVSVDDESKSSRDARENSLEKTDDDTATKTEKENDYSQVSNQVVDRLIEIGFMEKDEITIEGIKIACENLIEKYGYKKFMQQFSYFVSFIAKPNSKGEYVIKTEFVPRNPVAYFSLSMEANLKRYSKHKKHSKRGKN